MVTQWWSSRVRGPLAVHAAGFRQHLLGQGYAPMAVSLHLTGLRPSPTSRCGGGGLVGGVQGWAGADPRGRTRGCWLVALGDRRLRSSLDAGPFGPALNRPKRLCGREGL
jgi:hypothetical protein